MDGKKRITNEIVMEVKRTGRFLKWINVSQTWEEVPDEAARIKVAQALQYRGRRHLSEPCSGAKSVASERADESGVAGLSQRHDVPGYVAITRTAAIDLIGSHQEQEQASELVRHVSEDNDSSDLSCGFRRLCICLASTAIR
jgi:hypothetical protein